MTTWLNIMRLRNFFNSSRMLLWRVFLFKIKDLHSLYTKRLTDLGIEKCINKTVLKQSILDHFKTAHSQYDGKGALIAFSEGMQAMLKNAIRNRHCAKDAQILRQAANIVRKDILDHNGFRFKKCSKQCQEKCKVSWGDDM